MMRTLVVFAAAAVAAAVPPVSSAAIPPGFDEQCAEGAQGWPQFDSLADLQADKPWANYLKYIYGEFPTVFPVCIFDLAALDYRAVSVFGLNKTGQLPTPKPYNYNGTLKLGDLLIGGQMGMQIWHEKWRPVPTNGWAEVTHTVIPTELKGYWAWRQKGSGVWYNVGKTIVFPTPADMSKVHKEAIEFLTANCSVAVSGRWPQLESDIFGGCAREKGYDSIQFEPTRGAVPWGVFGLPGLTELVLVNADGDKGCGVANKSASPLRGGWFAERSCECDEAPIKPTCGMPVACPGGSCSPPLCAQEPCAMTRPPCIDSWCTRRLRVPSGDEHAEGERDVLGAAMANRAMANRAWI